MKSIVLRPAFVGSALPGCEPDFHPAQPAQAGRMLRSSETLLPENNGLVADALRTAQTRQEDDRVKLPSPAKPHRNPARSPEGLTPRCCHSGLLYGSGHVNL